MGNPKRLLVAGDIHADLDFQGYLYQIAQNRKCDAIFQLGDWGYWPHMSNANFQHVTKQFEKTGIPMYWIDGNHENFEWLTAEGHFNATDFSEVVPGLIYVPRGHRWEWSGMKFIGLGGAYSIDKAARRPRVEHWDEELITMGQVYKILEEPGKVDIMFSHDAPMWPAMPNGWRLDPKTDAISEANRYCVRTVVDHVKPTSLYHGHYHYSYFDIYQGDGFVTDIYGLDCNISLKRSLAWIVIHLENDDKED